MNRRPTLLEVERLRKGLLAADEAARIEQALRLHGDPTTGLPDDDDVFAADPPDLFVHRVTTIANPQRSSLRWVLLTCALVAASALLCLRPPGARVHEDPSPAPTMKLEHPDRPTSHDVIDAAPTKAEPTYPRARRAVVLDPGTRVIDADGPAAALLVVDGAVTAGSARAETGQWLLVTEDAELVFPDGVAPPIADTPFADPALGIDPQLEHLRTQALPERTLTTLERLLDKETP